MAKRKAAAGRTKRAKTTKKKTLRKKTSARAAKRTAKKKVVRKVAKKTAKRKTAKKVVKRPVKAVKAKRAVKVAPAKPKRPRRTKQALPPKKLAAPPPVMEVEPVGPAPAAPPRVTAPPVEAEMLEAARRPMPATGDLAPDFQLADEAGGVHSLAQYRGKRVVLYFYPKDDTPGCTAEACGFRNSLGAFTDRNAVVLGISPDSVESHQRFAQKYGLTFPLLADVGHKVAESYGVWVEKERLGEKTMGIGRTTFVIDGNGRIAHVFRDVRPEGHDQEVLQHLPL
jgi:peroxiredoxin Q/BCP